MKKTVALTLSAIMLGTLSANALTPEISGGTLDRKFTNDRTLYYVKPSGDEIPEITAEDGTVVKKATDSGDNNLTVIKDNESGKEYRFVIESVSKPQIETLSVSAEGELTITANLKGTVSLTLFKPTAAKAKTHYTHSNVDFSDSSDMQKKIFDTATLYTSNGTITYTFPKKAESGMYGIAVGTQGGYIEKEIYYTNADDIKSLIENLNKNISSQADLDNELLANGGVLGIDSEAYAGFTDKSIFYDMLVGKSFSADDTTDVVTAAKTALVLTELNHSKGQERLEIFINNANLFGIDLTGKYAELNNKTLPASFLNFKSVKTVSAAKTEFLEAEALSYIKEADKSNIKARFEGSLSSVRIPTDTASKYNSLSSNLKNQALSKLVDNNDKIVSADALSEQLLKAIGGIGSNSPSTSSKPSKVSSANVPAVSVSGATEPDSEKPQETVKVEFEDLDSVPWAKEAILLLKDRNAISGKSETEFAPNDYITREEFLKILVYALDLEDKASELKFTDVSESDWYYDAVSKAVKANITTGVSEDLFGTGQNITRQDMAVMIVRAANAAKITISGKSITAFSDYDEIADYAKEAVDSLISAGMISGMGDGTFAPNAFATRAQASKMIYNLIAND